MKERITSLDLKRIMPKLKEWGNSKVSKIYQTDLKETHLHLYDSGLGEKIFVIMPGMAVFLTDKKPKYPLKPPSFSMLLRKHLVGSKLVGIKQRDFDRIIELTFKRKETKRLIIELFGKGNIILCDSDYQIIQPLKFQEWRARTIKSHVKYEYPPISGKSFLNLGPEKFKRLVDIEKEIVKFLASDLLLGSVYAEEICYRANIDKKTLGKNLSQQELKKLYNQLLRLFNEDNPSVYLKNGSPYVFAPFKLESLTECTLKTFESFNQAIDSYFSKLKRIRKKSKGKKEVMKELERLKNIKKRQKESVQRAKENVKKYKKFADYLKMNLRRLQGIFNKIKKLKETQPIEELEEKYSVKFVSPKKLILEGIPLSIIKSIPEQMEDYYEKYKKTKKKIKGAKKAIKETEKKIKRVQKEPQAEKKIVEKREGKWYERFYWFYTSEGFLVLGGRNSDQNDELIKKYTEEQDIVFHAVTPSPFCIIKTQGKEVGEKSLKETARFCASYSKAWRRGLGVIDVFWVKPDQLKAFPSKGGFDVEGKRNYYRSVPLQVALGVKNNVVKGGPVSAINKQLKHYVVLKPGQEEIRILAEKIRDNLKEKVSKGKRKEIERVNLDKICKFIPGKAQIIRIK